MKVRLPNTIYDIGKSGQNWRNFTMLFFMRKMTPGISTKAELSYSFLVREEKAKVFP